MQFILKIVRKTYYFKKGTLTYLKVEIENAGNRWDFNKFVFKGNHNNIKINLVFFFKQQFNK